MVENESMWSLATASLLPKGVGLVRREHLYFGRFLNDLIDNQHVVFPMSEDIPPWMFEELTEWIIQGIISAGVVPLGANEAHHRGLRGIMIQDIRHAVLERERKSVAGESFGREEEVRREAYQYGIKLKEYLQENRTETRDTGSLRKKDKVIHESLNVYTSAPSRLLQSDDDNIQKRDVLEAMKIALGRKHSFHESIELRSMMAYAGLGSTYVKSDNNCAITAFAEVELSKRRLMSASQDHHDQSLLPLSVQQLRSHLVAGLTDQMSRQLLEEFHQAYISKKTSSIETTIYKAILECAGCTLEELDWMQTKDSLAIAKGFDLAERSLYKVMMTDSYPLGNMELSVLARKHDINILLIDTQRKDDCHMAIKTPTIPSPADCHFTAIFHLSPYGRSFRHYTLIEIDDAIVWPTQSLPKMVEVLWRLK